MSTNLAVDLSSSNSGKSQEEKHCKPFLKWAGGKSNLVSEIKSLLPKSWNRYHEPMLGGAALFFSLEKASETYLSDCNAELINVYKVVRDNLDELIEHLQVHQHNKDYFYKIRALDRTDEYPKLSNIEKASRFIYLNKTCFNGLYRVNSKGQFNVPFGDYKKVNIVNKETLAACSKKLQNCHIEIADFSEVLKRAASRDLVYFDPPYVPLNKTSSFTSYTQDGFTLNDHVQLFEVMKELREKGVFAILSNSYTEFVLGSSKGLNVHLVESRRAINSKASGRGAVKEIVVTNY